MKSLKLLHELIIFVFLSLLLPFALFSQPVILNVSPNSGSIAGGETITIQGNGFTGTTQVLFGQQTATIQTVTNTLVTVIAPANVPKVVDIVITTTSGTSSITQYDRYAFQGNWEAFIPDFGSNNVYTSNTSTMLVNPNPITVGTQPNDVCVSSDGSQAFVVNSGSSNITPIDVLSSTPGTNIPANGSFPILMALTVDPITGNEIGYTANYLSNTISQINLTTSTVLNIVNVGSNPTSGAIVLDLNQQPPVPLYLYVTNSGSSNITVVNLSDFSTTTLDIGPGSVPSFICVDPNGTSAYYSDNNVNQNSVTQIVNVNTATPSFGTQYTDPSFNFSGQNLFPQIAVSPDGLNLYITNTGSNTVSYINLVTSAICPITVEFGPNGAAITPDGSELYVCNSVSNAISIISGLPSCSPGIVNLLVGTVPTDPSISPDPAPLAYFTVTPTSGEPGQIITFDPTLSVSPVGTIARYEWNFGDGNITTTFPNSPLATHAYAAGTYTVTLTVVNTAGTSTSDTFTYNGKQVLRDGGPTALFSVPIIITPKATIPTMTTLTTNPANSALLGQNVTFTADVSFGGGIPVPNGFVQFKVDGMPYGSPVQVDNNGVASINDSALTGGPHIITAQYLGTSTYDPSLSNPVNINIILDSTIVSLTSDQSGCAAYGDPITFTAVVTANNPDISGTPTGTVIFIDTSTFPETIFGGGTLMNGVAIYTTTFATNLSVGVHTIIASYSGDINHSANDSPPFTQNICPADTTTVITSSENPSPYGDLITFFATVTPVVGSGIPQGLVEFDDGINLLGYGFLNNGHAQFTLSDPINLGMHTIKATYINFDGNYNTSNDSLIQIVTQLASTTTITSSLNPAYAGQDVTFTTTVIPTGPSSFVPTGTITYSINGILGTPIPLVNGQASFTTSTVPTGDNNSIIAYYSGDTIFLPSNASLIQIINPIPTTTTLTSSLNPSFEGNAITFVATVNPNIPTSLIPTGTITFSVNGVLGNPTPLVNGNASFLSATLPVGANAIIAYYSGDGNFTASNVSLEQIVNPIPTMTVLVSSLNPAVNGTAVTFTATIVSSLPTALIPTGTVTFSINGVLGTPILLVNGQASLTTSSLLPGNNLIIAYYSGDTAFVPSFSPPLNELIIVLSPTNLKICQEKIIFSTQKEYQNVITGQASSSAGQVVEFRIYRDSVLTILAGDVPAKGNHFKFIDHNRVKNVRYVYYVVSVNSVGVVSSVGIVSN